MIDSETIFNLIKDRVRYSGSNEAIYDYIEKKSYTYKDLDIRSDNLSRFLKKELNLKKGDLIGFCATNSIAFFDAFFSTFKSGIIITTYNCFLHPKELIPMIKNEMPKVIFYSSEFAETIKDIRETGLDLVFICIDDSKPEECYSYLDVMSNTDYEPVEMTQLNFEDIQMLIHTGGTTGQPKAAMISFRALLYNAISDITLFQLSEADSAILSLPLFHTAGWNIFTIPLLLIGGRIIYRLPELLR